MGPAKDLKTVTLILIAITSITAVAHKGERHDTGTPVPKAPSKQEALLSEIGREYEKTVKPIFQNKCMDCHSENTSYPWYYKLPFAKGLIDKDIAESREHLDMTSGFPFKSHGTPLQDLDAIAESVKEESMPPLRYRLLHPSSGLSAEEKQIVLSWVEQSRKTLARP